MEPIFVCRAYASGHPFRGGMPSRPENLKRDHANTRRAEDLPHRAYRPARLHFGRRLSLVRRKNGNENVKRHDDRYEQHQAAASHESLA